jgi:hypothetical protein
MKIIYNSFASKVKSRLADLTDLSRVNVTYYKDTEDIDWFCDSINKSLKYDMNDMLHKAIANGTAMYDDTDIPEYSKINGNNLMVNNSVNTDILVKAQESVDSNKKYYYKVKQSTIKNDILTAIGAKNIHDNTLRDYMYVEDDSPDLKGVIEWMKMVIDINLFRKRNISVELCTTHEFAKNYNSKSDSISVTQAEYLYGVNKIEHVDVICFNSIEEVYDDFERLNAENEKNGLAFEDALIFHLSDAENNKEYIELLQYE